MDCMPPGFARFPLYPVAKKKGARKPHTLVETMEPEWTKAISSTTVCNWYWVFFIVSAVLSVGLVLAIITLFAMKGISIRDGGFKLFMLIVQLGITTTSMLFYYIMCDRALKPTQ